MKNRRRGFLMIDALTALLIISASLIMYTDFNKQMKTNLNIRKEALIKKRIMYEQQKGVYND